MKLLDYMRRQELDDETLARRIGDCTAHAVKKWKYGERRPDADRILKIQKITGGHVTLRDWASEAVS
jgi:DNA-binding transcriptional regulator YdaS (Cro superfamily)